MWMSRAAPEVRSATLLLQAPPGVWACCRHVCVCCRHVNQSRCASSPLCNASAASTAWCACVLQTSIYLLQTSEWVALPYQPALQHWCCKHRPTCVCVEWARKSICVCGSKRASTRHHATCNIQNTYVTCIIHIWLNIKEISFVKRPTKIGSFSRKRTWYLESLQVVLLPTSCCLHTTNYSKKRDPII